jgi:hypothetical protein
MNREVKKLLMDIVVLDSEQEQAPSLGDMAKRAMSILDRYTKGRLRRLEKSRPRRAEKQAARDERNAGMATIRAEVMRRAAGTCELCHNDKVHEVHHLIGGAMRRKMEATNTCIGLCLTCHRNVHDSEWATMVNLELWAKTNASWEAARLVTKRVTRLALLRSEP